MSVETNLTASRYTNAILSSGIIPDQILAQSSAIVDSYNRYPESRLIEQLFRGNIPPSSLKETAPLTQDYEEINQLYTDVTRIEQTLSSWNKGAPCSLITLHMKEELSRIKNDEEELSPLDHFQNKYRVRTQIFKELRDNINSITEDQKKKIVATLKFYNALEQYAESQERVLYDKQMPAWHDIHETFEQGLESGHIVIPTGVGKSVLITQMVKLFVEATGKKALVVTAGKTLVEQTRTEFNKHASNIHTSVLYSKEKDTQGQVMITTFNSGTRYTSAYEPDTTELTEGTDTDEITDITDDPDDIVINPQDYDLVIVDEGHAWLNGSQFKKFMNKFPHATQIALTATPKHIKDMFPTEIHRMTIREAIDKDMIVPFDTWIVKTSLNVKSTELLSGKGLQLDDEKLNEKLNILGRNRAAIDIYKKNFLNQQAIFNCLSIAHAKEMQELLESSGVKVGFVYANQNDNERKNIIEQYQRGEINVLCNVRALTLGFNAPNTVAVFNLRPTFSHSEAIQRAGRALRTADGKEKAYIIEFLDEYEDDDLQPVLFENASKEQQPEKIDDLIKNFLAGKKNEHSQNRQMSREIKILDLDLSQAEVHYTITTDQSEITRIVMLAENKVLNGLDLVKLDYKTIASLTGLSELQLKNLFNNRFRPHLAENEYLTTRGNQGTFLQREKLALFLEKAQEMKKVIDAMVPLDGRAISSQLGISITTVNNLFRDIKNSLPPDSHLHWGGKLTLLTQEARTAFVEFLQTLQQSVRINSREIAKQVGIDERYVNELRANLPKNFFVNFYGKKTPYTTHANLEAFIAQVEIRKAELAALSEMMEINLTATAVELGVPHKYFAGLMQQLPPDQYISGKGQKTYIHPDAWNKVLEQVTERKRQMEGKVPVEIHDILNQLHADPTIALSEIFNPDSIKKLIAPFLQQHEYDNNPDYYVYLGGNLSLIRPDIRTQFIEYLYRIAEPFKGKISTDLPIFAQQIGADKTKINTQFGMYKEQLSSDEYAIRGGAYITIEARAQFIKNQLSKNKNQIAEATRSSEGKNPCVSEHALNYYIPGYRPSDDEHITTLEGITRRNSDNRLAFGAYGLTPLLRLDRPNRLKYIQKAFIHSLSQFEGLVDNLNSHLYQPHENDPYLEADIIRALQSLAVNPKQSDQTRTYITDNYYIEYSSVAELIGETERYLHMVELPHGLQEDEQKETSELLVTLAKVRALYSFGAPVLFHGSPEEKQLQIKKLLSECQKHIHSIGEI